VREEVLALARAADILLESQTPGRLAVAGLGPEALHAANPRLVITSVTDFGQTGPYRDWVGTDWVHLALSSVLSRSGNPGRPPLMPPGRLAAEHGAAQAAWATLVAYWWALETGQGEHVDVSLFEATVLSLGRRVGHGRYGDRWNASERPPARSPGCQLLLPDLLVRGRVCAHLHAGQAAMAAMFSWLGEPAEFADPKYDAMAARYQDRDRLYPLIAALFADRAHVEVVDDGQRRGIPIEAVKLASEVLVDEHLNARGAFVDIQLPSGRSGRMRTAWSRSTAGGSATARRSTRPAPGAAFAPARPLPRRRPPGLRARPTPARCPGCGSSISGSSSSAGKPAACSRSRRRRDQGGVPGFPRRRPRGVGAWNVDSDLRVGSP
jgi:crotonobetainyl-CoA:carnitine CoA-transferase CaiB-like acyl-CoA transferase